MGIGVIGGGDGPTSVIVTSSISSHAIATIAIACIAMVGVIIIIWISGNGKKGV